MILSSSSEWASISSPSLMPQGRNTKFVEALTSHTSGLKRNMNRLKGRLIQSEVPSALWMEKYFGACSPKTRCAYVMTANPRTTAMMLTTRSLVIPNVSRRGAMRWETAGSPTQPRPREATVIPTWQTERLASRSRRASCTTRARALPSCSSCTMRDSRTRTRANSAATKKPLRATSTSATKRLSNEDKRGSSKSSNPRQQRNRTAGVQVQRSRAPPSCYDPYYTAATPAENQRPRSTVYYGAILVFLRSEEHTSELQSRQYLVCRLLLEKK